jgi:hypothetical protein
MIVGESRPPQVIAVIRDRLRAIPSRFGWL